MVTSVREGEGKLGGVGSCVSRGGLGVRISHLVGGSDRRITGGVDETHIFWYLLNKKDGKMVKSGMLAKMVAPEVAKK